VAIPEHQPHSQLEAPAQLATTAAETISDLPSTAVLAADVDRRMGEFQGAVLCTAVVAAEGAVSTRRTTEAQAAQQVVGMDSTPQPAVLRMGLRERTGTDTSRKVMAVVAAMAQTVPGRMLAMVEPQAVAAVAVVAV
jgi:hypothetical protein